MLPSCGEVFPGWRMKGYYEVPQWGVHPGAAGRPTVIVSALANLSPTYINVPAASGSRLGGRGVKGDS